MASFVLTDAYVAINSVDWSSKVREIKINTSADVVENTAMSASWKTRLPSLKDFSLDITFNQDHANSGLDDSLWALFGTSTTFEIRPTSSSVGSSNPKWTGSAILQDYQPIGGSVGSNAELPVKFMGTGALTRAES